MHITAKLCNFEEKSKENSSDFIEFCGFVLVILQIHLKTAGVWTKPQSIMKALFFDIDGTLIDIKTHKIPESTITAIREAKKNGNKIFIATGRSHTIVNLPGIPANLIDGYITLNGAVCLDGNEPFRLLKIPTESVRALSEVCIRENFTCLFVTLDGMAVANADKDFIIGFEKYFNLAPVPVTDFDTMIHKDIYQMTVFFDEATEKKLKPLFPELEFNRWFPTFADITCREANKASGIEAVARHFRIDMKDTIAFGDGGNDIPMFRRAAVGVAMDNASDEVKVKADIVTDAVDKDGIYNALRRLKIIDG